MIASIGIDRRSGMHPGLTPEITGLNFAAIIHRGEITTQREIEMPTFKEKWKHAKEAFQQTARVKKPSAKVDSYFRKPAGIDSALEKVDAAEPKMLLNKAGYDAFVAASAGFKTA